MAQRVQKEPKEPKRRDAKQLSDLDHLKKTSVYVGNRENQDFETYVLNDEKTHFVRKIIKYTPAFNKIFDEVVVNAIDHWVNYPNDVTSIEITFDPSNGEISVYNNGPGMPVRETSTLAGVKMWMPQMIASEFRVGDNFDATERITGGANGIGLKATNAFSSRLMLETCDTESKKLYVQVFRNGLSDIDPPKITTARRLGFTRITFVPIYEQFGYEGGYKVARDAADIAKLIELRAYQAAVYTGIVVKLHIKDGINAADAQDARKIKLKLVDFAAMFIQPSLDLLDEVAKETKPVKLTFMCKNHDKYKIEAYVLPSDGKARQMSIINGVCAYEGGTHIEYVTKTIADELKTKLNALATKIGARVNVNMIINNLFIVARATIPNPSWGGGNLKSKLENSLKTYATYELVEGKIASIWPIVQSQITAQFIDKNTEKVKRVSRTVTGVKKLKDALYAGDKNRASECTLFICEGDSAESPVRQGMLNNPNITPTSLYGTYNIQGVPVNARKEVVCVDKLTRASTAKAKAKSGAASKAATKAKTRAASTAKSKVDVDTDADSVDADSVAAASTTTSTAASKYIQTKKLTNNDRINGLIKALGLDRARTYDTDADMKTLRYGRVIVATDQDEDGKGNIFGLILSNFHVNWPCLLRRGFVLRLNTPIIRAFPKSVKEYVVEFYSVHNYKQWVKTKFGMEDLVRDKYLIKYYKGLGSHNEEEQIQFIKAMQQHLIHYTLDEKAEETMNIYYGKDSKQRKVALVSPVSEEDELKMLTNQTVDISLQLNVDTKSYQRENIIRKIPHVLDGFVPARRKIFYGSRAIFRKSNKQLKLCNVAAEVGHITEYQHAEASLHNAIIRMAQDYPGARNLPFMRPRGMFGTRANGGNDAASPRYIFTNMNTRLANDMFPPVDDYLLPYEYDEGKRIEPQYYLPVIPLAVLESMEVPATGWKVCLFARDIDEVIANVRAMIGGQKHAAPMKIWQNKVDTVIREIEKGTKKTLYSYGRYKFDETNARVVVTELPIGKFSHQIVEQDEEELREEMSRPPLDETRNDRVRITFFLCPDKIAHIKEKYGDEYQTPFEHYLGLRSPINSTINLIDCNKKIIEIKGEKYEKIVDIWFEERKKLYGIRIDREIILSQLRIVYYENIIKFAQNHDKYAIGHKTGVSELEHKLKNGGHDMINHTLLFSPEYTKNEELVSLILVRNKDISAASDAKKAKSQIMISKANKADKADEVDEADEADEAAEVDEADKADGFRKGASFTYLMNLKYRDLIERACKKRIETLEAEKKHLQELLNDCGDGKGGSKFKGMKTWLAELDKLEATIKLGLEKGWDYGKAKPKFAK